MSIKNVKVIQTNGTIQNVSDVVATVSPRSRRRLSRTQSCYEMTTAMHDSASSGNGTVALQLLGMTGRLPVVDFHSKHALSGPALKEMDANFVAAAPDRCDDRCSNKGWCSAHGFCVCFFGFKGRSCGEVDDAVYCSNSCSAHGVCMSGFCQCDKGFFGTDCSLTKADDGTTLTSYAPPGWLTGHMPRRHTARVVRLKPPSVWLNGPSVARCPVSAAFPCHSELVGWRNGARRWAGL